MEEEGCRGKVIREIVEIKESEGEAEGQRGRGQRGRGAEGQRGRQRETNNQLVHSDTLRMRTIRDCNATHLLLDISFIYLLKCKKGTV